MFRVGVYVFFQGASSNEKLPSSMYWECLSTIICVLWEQSYRREVEDNDTISTLLHQLIAVEEYLKFVYVTHIL